MTRYRVLHIDNDYSGSTVYMNLIQNLDELGVQQIVYVPIRGTNGVGKNKVPLKMEGSEILYRDILNYTTDRYFYPLKINKIYKDIQRYVDFTKIDFIHAHTWYSDGGVAYLLSEKYNLPYIVTVRNTDLNVFQKKAGYLHSFGRRILKNAEKVILISTAYKERVLELPSLARIRSTLAPKLKVIPNGVDPFWIKHANNSKELFTTDKFNLLYIGKFNRAKNVNNLQNAVRILNEVHHKSLILHLVGGGGNEEQKILDQIEMHSDIFIYHGKIYDKNKLLGLYRSCDIFTMPSLLETFGLVYVEAMLQGLPILYTRKEGIDGFYDEKIGEAVTIGDVEDIKEKLLFLLENYNHYKVNVPLLKKNHDWKLIAEEYLKLYQE